MISESELIKDLEAVLGKHVKSDLRLELALTLHVRPSMEEVPGDGGYVPDVKCIRIDVDAQRLGLLS